jgi:hypothetical protein
MAQPEAKSRPHWTAGAVALVVIGLLILVPSGLCTAVIGGISIFEMFSADSSNESLSDIFSFLLYGAPFIALGAILVYAGFKARKQN